MRLASCGEPEARGGASSEIDQSVVRTPEFGAPALRGGASSSGPRPWGPMGDRRPWVPSSNFETVQVDMLSSGIGAGRNPEIA